MNSPESAQPRPTVFDADYITVQGHDLQDILMRIDMSWAKTQFQTLKVRLNPLVDCTSPGFLAEVWGMEGATPGASCQCLYLAPETEQG
ncbi:MAG: hypothetical protein HC824_15610 [Synechococcales cyanobacterium RM1_1_8]|nr:hypothetical protein [Synechococcales cyanobacterium RM1_1_8]